MTDTFGGAPVAAQEAVRRHAGWFPTRKWMVGQITALGALLTMVVTTGGWDQEETVALVGLVVAGATAYLVPNLDAPGGVSRQR